ncbi:MAG: class I SAM-dependent methyltransferase [Spirochaetota bacterium]
MEHCPLCRHDASVLFHTDKFRIYLRCTVCDLVYVPDEMILSSDRERERYLEHNNSIDDEGYIGFLSRSLLPLLNVCSAESRILDFGSGPVPVLSTLIKDLGLAVASYDPFFQNDESVLNARYDVIISTEVFEHITNLSETLRLLFSILNSDGRLIIQTSFYPDKEAFRGWHYKNDLTHIRFFSMNTFVWAGNSLNATVTFPEADVTVMQKIL